MLIELRITDATGKTVYTAGTDEALRAAVRKFIELADFPEPDRSQIEAYLDRCDRGEVSDGRTAIPYQEAL